MAVTLLRDKFKIFQFRPQASISHAFSLHYLELKIAAFHRDFNCSTVQLFNCSTSKTCSLNFKFLCYVLQKPAETIWKVHN